MPNPIELNDQTYETHLIINYKDGSKFMFPLKHLHIKSPSSNSSTIDMNMLYITNTNIKYVLEYTKLENFTSQYQVSQALTDVLTKTNSFTFP